MLSLIIIAAQELRATAGELEETERPYRVVEKELAEKQRALEVDEAQ